MMEGKYKGENIIIKAATIPAPKLPMNEKAKTIKVKVDALINRERARKAILDEPKTNV